MGSKISPTVIGAFVVGAIVCIVAGVLLFGGGKFFKEKQPYVLFFDSSVVGLNVGAPVVFRGVQVGQVTEVGALADPTTFSVVIRVKIELVRGVIKVNMADQRFKDQHEAVEGLVQHGARASLRMQSFVTGLLYVAIDFHPGTPIRRLGLDQAHYELPTIPSDMDQLKSTIQEAVAELGKLPLDEVLNEVLGLFKRANSLLDLPEIKQALMSLPAVMTAGDDLLQHVDGQMLLLGTKLGGASDATRATMETARAALLDAQKLLRNTDGQVAPLASSAKDTLAAARGTLGQAQKSLSTLTDAASPALKQGEKALASVASLTGSTSPQLTDLSQTLRALEEAARAIRALADALQRNPESLLRGKAAAK